MEDALAQLAVSVKIKRWVRLNPCCNGRCTRTGIEFTYLDNGGVS